MVSAAYRSSPGGSAMLLRCLAFALLVLPLSTAAAELPPVTNVELQPLAAQVKRVLDALDYVGSPLPADSRQAIEEAQKNTDKKEAAAGIQAVLDRHCLAAVNLDTG